MTDARPTVSVLVPVHNCGPYLEPAVASVLGQTLTGLEVVAVNDGSTDGSLDVLRRIAAGDARVVVLDRPNGGIARALNAGLAACRGRLIARMDGDDLAEPDRLAAQIDFLDRHPDVGVVGGWATVIDALGRRTGEIVLPTEPHAVGRAIGEGQYAVLHPTMLVRRACLAAAGDYDPAFRYAEDLDLLLRLREVTRLANLPQHVLRYRRKAASMSDVGRGEYPAWDQKALLAAHRRGRRPVSAATLARAAERVSWTALDAGDTGAAARQAWQALRHAPWRLSGAKAWCRVGRHWLRAAASRPSA